MTVIKLPAKRLADLEDKVAQLEQHIEELNGRYEACLNLIDYIATKLPDEARMSIYEMVKSLTDFHATHPTLLDTADYRDVAYLQTFREFEGRFFWSVYSPPEKKV